MEAEGGAMSQIDYAGLAVYIVTTCYYLRSVIVSSHEACVNRHMVGLRVT